MMRLTPVVKNLLIINVLIFLIQEFSGINLVYWGGLRHIDSEMFFPFQFITYMFLHGGFGHVFSNMFGLFIFGPNLERAWGPKRFFLFWMITGVGAGLLFFGVNYYEVAQLKETVDAFLNNPNPADFSEFLRGFNPRLHAEYYDLLESFKENPENPYYITQSTQIVNTIYSKVVDIPMVGASGSLFGVLMGFGMLFPNTTLILLFPPIPVKAKYLVAFYGLYELYSGVNPMPGDNIAHYAHLGGMLFAFILVKIWEKDTKNFY